VALSREQEDFYRQSLSITRSQLDDLNGQIEEELAKVRERLSDLQTQKEAARQIYDGACRMLGIENDIEQADAAAAAAVQS
jgi:ElaB/YqjD/DUF883 family membrane-anchored ribosome-binding protein